MQNQEEPRLANGTSLEVLTPSGNLLVSLFNGYGDGFLALPLLREIGRRFKGHEVYFATYADYVSLFYHDLDFKFLGCKFPPSRGHVLTVLEDDLRDLDIQQVLSLNCYFPNSVDLESAAVFRRASRWAFYSPSGEPLILSTLGPDKHMRDLYFDAPGWEPAYTLADRQVNLPEEDFERVLEIYYPSVSNNGELFYVLHLDSQPQKMWPVDNWMEVVSHLWSRWRAWPLIIGLRTDQSDKLERAFPFCRKTPPGFNLSTHFAAVELARVFIGIDSLFAHIADSYEKPMVVLFGPTETAGWGPVSANSFVVRPDGGNRMQGISVDKVIDRVDAAFSVPD